MISNVILSPNGEIFQSDCSELIVKINRSFRNVLSKFERRVGTINCVIVGIDSTFGALFRSPKVHILHEIATCPFAIRSTNTVC